MATPGRQRKGLHRVVVVTAEDDAWLEASHLAAVEDDPGVGAVRCAANQGLVGELLQGDRSPAGEWVAVRDEEIERVVQQVGPVQAHLGLGQRLVIVGEGKSSSHVPASGSPLLVVVDHGQVDVGVPLGEHRDGAGTSVAMAVGKLATRTPSRTGQAAASLSRRSTTSPAVR